VINGATKLDLIFTQDDADRDDLVYGATDTGPIYQRDRTRVLEYYGPMSKMHEPMLAEPKRRSVDTLLTIVYESMQALEADWQCGSQVQRRFYERDLVDWWSQVRSLFEQNIRMAKKQLLRELQEEEARDGLPH
jgi:hypothetical protein